MPTEPRPQSTAPGEAGTGPRSFVSWNVNGLRSCLGKGLGDFVASCGADAICLQEVRSLPGQVRWTPPGYAMFWNPALRPGYSGVAILTRRPPLAVFPGLGEADLDGEGRVLTAEFADVFLVTAYAPNVGRDLARLPLRSERWDPAFLRFLRRLQADKPVIACGDLNVSHRDLDLARPRANRGNAGFTDEERAGFARLLEAGFLDAFRVFEPGGGHYTWWSNRAGVRERNIGWRIDYFLVSAGLGPRLQGAGILPQVLGSDHCPVTLDLA